MTKRSRKQQLVTLRGMITPADMDDMGRVTCVSIVTDDDEEYFIDPYGKGEHLTEQVDEYVVVSGTLHNDDGDYTISVTRWNVVADKEQDEDDEEEDDDPGYIDDDEPIEQLG